MCRINWPSWPVHDAQEENQLLEVLRSGNWWFGEKVQEFEREFAAFQGARFGVTCTNGTTALEMGLRALGVVEGDEVLVPCYTFIATASAVVTIGAVPVFVDIEPDTLCMDPDDAEQRITDRTRAIVPVHVAGRIADMQRIRQLAQQHGLALMEDAAHAWGSQLNGQGAGTLGQCGTFSFQVSKNITAGEGGILVSDDEQLAELCRSYTHCGRTKGAAWYDHDVLGSNLRMTEFQAAILVAQLSRLEDQVARRDRNAQLLEKRLTGVPGIHLLAPSPQMTRRSHHMYVFRLDEFALGLSRDRFLEALNAEGVPAIAGWYRPLYRNGVFLRAHVGPRHGIRAPLTERGVDYTNVTCPVCEHVCSDAVWIPQEVLLAEEAHIVQLANAIEKVVSLAGTLRPSGEEA